MSEEENYVYVLTEKDVMNWHRILNILRKDAGKIPKSDFKRIEKALDELSDLLSKRKVYINVPLSQIDSVLKTKELYDLIKKNGRAIVVYRDA